MTKRLYNVAEWLSVIVSCACAAMLLNQCQHEEKHETFRGNWNGQKISQPIKNPLDSDERDRMD